MPEARANEASAERGETELSGDALDLDGLSVRGDVAGLIALARAYRAGTAPGGRDMKQCFAAYRAAAALGSAEAEYATALFYLSGGIVSQDLKEGASRLRVAAEKGSVPAKVYLGNLYELGIHYKADPEKADVWYRNAARGARVDREPGSDDYARALAELGCARHALALAEGDTPPDEKARLLQRARAHGYGLRLRDEISEQEAGEGADAGADRPRLSPERAETAVPEPKAARPKRPISSRGAGGVSAFAYALLFALAGVGAGYAAMLGARELGAHGTSLPGLGARADLALPIVIGVVGVLPCSLVYRFGAVLKALVIGAGSAGLGWVAWGTGQAAFHAHRPAQALAFGLAGFLAALLVLGLLGGTKRRSSIRTR